MDEQIAAIREQIDRQTRPGQAGAATVAGRLVAANLLGGSLTRAGNVYEPTSGVEMRYGRYGRARYGEERYLALGVSR